MNTAIDQWRGVKRGRKIGKMSNTAPSAAARRLNVFATIHDFISVTNSQTPIMEHPFAKQPTAMELENLIYEVALNRALILILLHELEKHTLGITDSVQDVLNTSPRHVYELVSQFVEEPSPYYQSLLNTRQDYEQAQKAVEALKALLNSPRAR